MIGKPIAITPALGAKVQAFCDYGLTLHQIAVRVSLAESTVHKIAHPGGVQ